MTPSARTRVPRSATRPIFVDADFAPLSDLLPDDDDAARLRRDLRYARAARRASRLARGIVDEGDGGDAAGTAQTRKRSMEDIDAFLLDAGASWPRAADPHPLAPS